MLCVTSDQCEIHLPPVTVSKVKALNGHCHTRSSTHCNEKHQNLAIKIMNFNTVGTIFFAQHYHYHHLYIMVKWDIPLLCVWELLGLNLGPQTRYTDRVLTCFIGANAMIVTRIRLWLLPSTYLQFNID